MANAVTKAKIAMSLQVTETVDLTNTPFSGTALVSLIHNGLYLNSELGPATTIPAALCAFFQKALSSGAASIDLTTLPGTNGATIDGTGKKVQAIFLRNPSTNANSIAATFGASTPYLLAGAAWKVILLPGQSIVMFGNNATPTIGSGAKVIDLAGTGAQALDVGVILG